MNDQKTPDAHGGPDPSRSADPDAPGGHSRAEGVDHLQVAASELIAAARSFLDTIEEVVRDRDALSSVVDTIERVAEAAGQAAARVASTRAPCAPDRAGGGAGQAKRVQHIRVS